MKSKIFWFHYNKPQSNKVGRPQITVHYNGICHIVDNITVNVPVKGHIRKEQPKFVIKGSCKNFEIIDNIAHIN